MLGGNTKDSRPPPFQDHAEEEAMKRSQRKERGNEMVELKLRGTCLEYFML